MNTILKQFLLVSSIYLFTPTVDAFSLNDSLSKGSAALSSAAQVKGDAQQLVGQLQNQLGPDSIGTLTNQVSGLSGLLGGGSSLSKSLLSNISSMSGVQSAFSALGMDPAMIEQFLPIVLSFLGDQGVGASLLGQLQNLWTPPA